MQDTFYVPCKNTAIGGEDFDHVAVSVFHVNKRVRLGLYPASKDQHGIVTLAITSGKSITLEDMPRLNRKRMASLLETAKQQIHNKTGQVYDAIRSLGFTLA
jgi:hypothetical protein